ncbi:MAG: ribulose-phosphate 3-epimerase, partial [Candidatus Eisenbacteria bacterium]|nr:ribulose-phosphate 3-epimerase [Candidatus Eisenbacteria bacterium]
MAEAARSIPAGIQVAPSLLAADFARLGEEIRSVESAGVALLHLDVMDGHFVPNITFGPPLVAAVRRTTELFLDTHLMIRDPLTFLEPFARAGADLLTLHAEAFGDPGSPAGRGAIAAGLAEARRRLEPFRCRLGISFRPATDPLALLGEVGGALDLVLIMTVEPGFGGQAFLGGQLARVAAVDELRRRRGWTCRLEVDGGLGEATAGPAIAAGADVLV